MRLFILSILSVFCFTPALCQTEQAYFGPMHLYEPAQAVIDKNNEIAEIFAHDYHVYDNADSLRRALVLSKQAIAMDSDYLDSYGNAIFYLCRMDSAEQAVACIEKYIRRNPNNPVGLEGMGVMYEKVGRISEAHKCYEKAIQIFKKMEENDNNANIVLNRLVTMILLGQKDEALSEFKAYKSRVSLPADRLDYMNMTMDFYSHKDHKELINSMWQ